MKFRRHNRQDDQFDDQRRRMIDEQLRGRDITDAGVLAAMRRVPRHLFVSEKRRQDAYRDGPMSIGYGQTISQPYIVASMTQSLSMTKRSRVLEIGTGCGYQAAVLAELAGQVYSVEVVPELIDRARRILKQLGYQNIKMDVRDGYLGWPEEAPFDGIIVTAAAPKMPEPLIEQLKVGGIMVIPLATDSYGRQFLTRFTKERDGLKCETLYEVRFVPMIGEVEE
jgi:protein-L-isoaspartate(D-aspartate) O-methyltransferase